MSNKWRFPPLVLWACLVLYFALTCPGARPAAAAPERRPRVVVILVPGTPSEPVFEALSDPRWATLRAGSGLALMNSAMPGPDTRAGAYVALGAGQRLAAVDPIPIAHLGRGARFGSPARAENGGAVPYILAHTEKREATPGAVGEACRVAGKRVAYVGPVGAGGTLSGPGYVSAMDASGSIPRVGAAASTFPHAAWRLQSEAMLRTADLLYVDLPQQSAIDGVLDLAAHLTGDLNPATDLLIVTSPDPGVTERGQWMGLSPLLVWGQPYAGRWLISSTTRTAGLVANTDLAPTLLDHLGLPRPRGFEGHLLRADHAGTPAGLLTLARDARATRAGMLPGLLAWGILCFLAVACTTVVLLRRSDTTSRLVGRALLAAMAAGPLAMLLGALVPAGSVPELLARLSVILCLLTWASLRWGKRRAIPLIFALMLATMLADLVLHGPMLARNLLSDFADIGARFYGMGNEYEGLAIGIALLFPFVLADWRGAALPPRALAATTAGLWLAILILVGHPALGADFGGAVSLAVAYLVALAVARGRRPTLLEVAGAVTVVVVVAGLAVLLDLQRPAGMRSHVGELASRAIHGGPGLVLEIAGRKVLENVRMAFSVYFVGGVIAVAPLVWLWYHKLGRRAWSVLAARPLLRGGVVSTFLGGLAAGLLNDTGVVAWVMASGCGLILWLDLLLASDAMFTPTKE